MPFVACTDFETYAAAMPGDGVQLLLTDAGRFEGWLRRHRGARCWVTHGEVRRPHLLRLGTTRRAIFTMLTTPDGAQVFNGEELRPGQVAWSAPGIELNNRVLRGTGWATWSFPLAAFEAAAAQLLGPVPAFLPAGVRLLDPPPGTLPWLLRCLVRLIRNPGTEEPAVVEDLLHATLSCLPRGEAAAPSHGQRGAVLERLAALADAADGDALTVQGACAALGVKLRTLNACTQVGLGLSAGTYLRRRRLHAAHAALRDGSGVTEAATAQGFWELGRFAAEYRALFGQAPSVTARLRRAAAAP